MKYFCQHFFPSGKINKLHFVMTETKFYLLISVVIYKKKSD